VGTIPDEFHDGDVLFEDEIGDHADHAVGLPDFLAKQLQEVAENESIDESEDHRERDRLRNRHFLNDVIEIEGVLPVRNHLVFQCRVQKTIDITCYLLLQALIQMFVGMMSARIRDASTGSE
jgi:hypothetical protein